MKAKFLCCLKATSDAVSSSWNTEDSFFYVFIMLALPNNWFRFGSKLLKFFPEKKTWGQAQNNCLSLGGGLESINSEHENEFLCEMFVKNISILNAAGFITI